MFIVGKRGYHIPKMILNNTESNLLPKPESHLFTLNSALKINFILALFKNSFPGSI